MAEQSPEEVLAEMRARLAISQRYLSRDDNPDLDPEKQEQLDKNRVPGEFGDQFSPRPGDPPAARVSRERTMSGGAQSFIGKSLHDRPYATLAAAAFLGFAVGALWKS